MYLEIDEGFVTHRKTLRFCALMQSNNGFAYILRLWSWACRSAPDGDLTGMESADIEIAVQYSQGDGRCYESFVKAGFIDAGATGEPTALHNWMERTGAAIRKMADEAKRKKTWREAHAGIKCTGKDACPACSAIKRLSNEGLSADCPRTVQQTSEGHPADFPTQTRQDQSRPDQTSFINTDIESVSVSGNDEPDVGPKPTSYPAAFEAVWDCTGKRGTKFAALKAWKKVGAPGRDRIDGPWSAYLASDRPAAGFVKDLSTWLNERGWEQEWLPARVITNGATGPPRDAGPKYQVLTPRKIPASNP